LQVKDQLSHLVEERTEEPQSLSTVPILIVHAHSACNCRCIMCDIWKTREQNKIGVREIERQLESIRRLGVRWIVFSGGEPLMNSELPEICALLRTEGIRLTLLSTGLLLKKCADDVAESFNDVIVSLERLTYCAKVSSRSGIYGLILELRRVPRCKKRIMVI
jgi:Fe-coproporphyrin III synthase